MMRPGSGHLRVIKVGGHELELPGFRDALARAVADLAETVVLVHGGGRSVDELQERLDIHPVKVEGLRFTDDETLRLTTMVLCGWVSKQLVAALIASGVDAVGLSGVDGGLIRVRKMVRPSIDLGLVGEIVSVRSGLLEALLARGTLPVVAPVSLGVDGRIYNVNADQAAAAIAEALQADSLDFVSNVPGVLHAGEVVPRLQVGEAQSWIATGEINGGMIPKVSAALEALRRGIPRVRIVGLEGLKRGGGTTFAADPSQPTSAI